MNELLLNVDDVSYRYRRDDVWALQHIQLPIARGKVLGLLGPNGAGKSTLMAILSGLLKGETGSVQWFDADNARPLFALVPQEYAFYPSLSCLENLHCFAGVAGLKGERQQQRIAAVVAQTELQQVLDKPAQYCSGGLKRRLNLAIGLLAEPQLLLLDEPTVGVDPQARNFLLQCVHQLRASGTTIVYTSHYMEEVQTVSDDIAIIDAGRILSRGTLDTLLQQHGKQMQVLLSRDLLDHEVQTLRTQWTIRTMRDRHLGIALAERTPLEFLQQLHALNIAVEQIQYGARNLEDVFLQLTQRGLRD